MSTNSRIGIEDQDGKVRSIYCHHDGYLSYVGEILLYNYKTREKVEELIALGSISSLYPNVSPAEGVAHNFKNPAENVTIAYHRDRGEELSIESHSNVDEFFKENVQRYCYVFSAAGEWLFNEGFTRSNPLYITLESAIANSL